MKIKTEFNSDQIIIPWHLHHLNVQRNHLQSQRIGMLLGAIFYPTVALITLKPIIVTCSFFCVGTHFISTRLAYRAAQQELMLEAKISSDQKLDETIHSKIREGKISRFYFDLNGNLIFLTNPSKFSFLKGMPLYSSQKESQDSLLKESISSVSQSIFKDQISYFHLDDETKKQVDGITQARSLRFRSGVAMMAGCGILSTIVYQNLFSGFLVAGLLHLGTKTSYKVESHTDSLWDHLREKKTLNEIVKPAYQDQEEYASMFQNEKRLFLDVTLFGNIRVSEKPPFFYDPYRNWQLRA